LVGGVNGMRRERNAARRRALAAAGDLLDLVARFLERDAQRLQHLSSGAVTHGEQARRA
jgi:hypothetical protein